MIKLTSKLSSLAKVKLTKVRLDKETFVDKNYIKGVISRTPSSDKDFCGGIILKMSFEDAGIHFGTGLVKFDWNRIVVAQNGGKVFIAMFDGEMGNSTGRSLAQPSKFWHFLICI